MTILIIRAFRLVFLLALAACLSVASIGGDGEAYASGGGSASKGGHKTGGEGGHGEKKGKKDKDQDITGGRFTGDPIYVRLPVLVLPVISERGAQQTVTLLVNVEVDSLGTANDLHDKRPRVMDALMRALYGKLGEGDLLEGALVDVGRVKEQATKAVTEITGPNKVRNVLIQGVAQRIY